VKLQKTLKLPVSEEITQEKLDRLDRLTARITYGTELFLERVIENDITTKSKANRHNKEIQGLTGLPSAFVQCCRDRALWMYKEYKTKYRKWERKVTNLEKKTENCKNKKTERKYRHKLYRLKKREPSLPTVKNKIPAQFDRRVGLIQVQPSDTAKEFDLWCRISTLNKGERMDVPLYSYPYAESHITSDEWKIKSFQIVWRSDIKRKRYEIHVVAEKEIEVSEPDSAVGIDLGLKRLLTAYETGSEGDRVTFAPKEDHKEFFIRMRRLNNRIGKLQRLGKVKALKKLKRKRKNCVKDFRRKLAVSIAKNFENSIVFIGHPQHIRTDKHYKGSGNRRNRKRVNHWGFIEFAETLKTELMENGNLAYIVNEWGSTKACSNCGSRSTQINDREFECLKCGYRDDRDVNGAKNILKKGLKKIDGAKVLRKGAGVAVAQPKSGDDWVEETHEPTTSSASIGCPSIH